ncbi:MAG: C10 family peptidase, partial [Bacteroidales bacterium]|nr:C10 family peptidase [Bacteroidales bacterium]
YMSFSKAVNDNFTAVQKTNIQTRWNQLTGKTRQTPRVECWPAPGSTATEGWVETRWTQTSPYNLMCPMDPENNTRSYAGCPAIVMSQVLNYLRTTHHTRFNDSDDYLHNYGGRVYDIDDDADSLRFPSFPVLNGMLDDADSLYALNEAIGNSLAAALVFASGTACTQVYTSEGSGTFAVNQAYQAYQRFGFGNSILYQTADSGMYANLIDNLKNGYPAHLALVDEAWSTGHNVVVDGYRADGYFHINFGWGGQSDGWWLVPDPAFPYSLGVLEGIVVNIIPDEVGITESASNKSFVIRPNPAEDTIYLSSLQDDNVRYSIFSVNGQQVQKGKTDGIISVSKLCSGTYILNIDTPNGKLSEKFIVVKNH